MKQRLWWLCYGLVLAAFTIYLTLDTFVLRSQVQTGATEQNTAMFETLSAADETAEDTLLPDTTSENSTDSNSKHHPSHSGMRKKTGGKGKHSAQMPASDSTSESESNSVSAAQTGSDGTSTVLGSFEKDGVSITLTRYRVDGTNVYVADVTADSAQKLQTSFAEDSFGRNVTETTSAIAKAHNAILAINGDYYGGQETGCVIRNGVVYRENNGSKELLCIYADGTMEVIDSGTCTAQELVDRGVWQAFSFGPGLVENSAVSVSADEEVGKAMASNPRTAIGLISANHYVFVVSDGRTEENAGLSLHQLASFMTTLGVKTAYNLDGGGSSTMYFNGEVVNQPTTNGNIRERGVSDIVYFGT